MTKASLLNTVSGVAFVVPPGLHATVILRCGGHTVEVWPGSPPFMPASKRGDGVMALRYRYWFRIDHGPMRYVDQAAHGMEQHVAENAMLHAMGAA